MRDGMLKSDWKRRSSAWGRGGEGMAGKPNFSLL
jgi:hypothetical protein